jgi:predicted YcjX-like family ATPase
VAPGKSHGWLLSDRTLHCNSWRNPRSTQTRHFMSCQWRAQTKQLNISTCSRSLRLRRLAFKVKFSASLDRKRDNLMQIFFSPKRFCTLLPGDIILTGTPPGVGVFAKPSPQFLKVCTYFVRFLLFICQ